MTSLDDFMGAIRQVESGGNYGHPPNASGASGAYQFIDSTWGHFGGYQSAYQAPPDVQDARARQLMQAYYDQFGDWEHVAAAWIGGPGTAAKGPGAWGDIRDSNMSVSAYVSRVMGALGGGAANVSLGAAAGAGATAGIAVAAQPKFGNLTAALGIASGQSLEDAAKLTSMHGDSLGDRMSAIHQILSGEYKVT